MKKLLGILLISLLWCGASFAMSSTYEKAYYDICYPQIKKLSNPTRAKQYCTCTIKMMSNKYSDKAKALARLVVGAVFEPATFRL